MKHLKKFENFDFGRFNDEEEIKDPNFEEQDFTESDPEEEEFANEVEDKDEERYKDEEQEEEEEHYWNDTEVIEHKILRWNEKKKVNFKTQKLS